MEKTMLLYLHICCAGRDGYTFAGALIREGVPTKGDGMGETADQQYRERAKRVDDALNLRVPDRIPLEIAFGYFPAKYAGITCEAAYYDYEAWLAACKKTVADFRADISSVQPFFPGKPSSCSTLKR